MKKFENFDVVLRGGRVIGNDLVEQGKKVGRSFEKIRLGWDYCTNGKLTTLQSPKREKLRKTADPVTKMGA